MNSSVNNGLPPTGSLVSVTFEKIHVDSTQTVVLSVKGHVGMDSFIGCDRDGVEYKVTHGGAVHVPTRDCGRSYRGIKTKVIGMFAKISPYTT